MIFVIILRPQDKKNTSRRVKQFLLGIKFILKMNGSQNRGAKTYQDDDETLHRLHVSYELCDTTCVYHINYFCSTLDAFHLISYPLTFAETRRAV